MPPRRIGPRTPQESWDSETQWGSNGEWDSNGEWASNGEGNSSGEWDSNAESSADAEWDSNVEGPSNDEWDSNNEWEPASANIEEVPATVIEEPAPVLTEGVPDYPFTWTANEEAAFPKENAQIAADNKPVQTMQSAESEVVQPKLETEAQPVEALVSQKEQQTLTPEEKKAKEKEAWQKVVAERKARFLELQKIKNEKARKLFNIFEENRKEERRKSLQNGGAVKIYKKNSRIYRRGIFDNCEKASRIHGRGIFDSCEKKLKDKAEKEKQRELKEKKADEEKQKKATPTPTPSAWSNGSKNYPEPTFMQNLLKAIKGPNAPVREGLPGLGNYDEELQPSSEDPRRIHRVLKVVLGRELFDELSDLPWAIYDAQDNAARMALLIKVLQTVKKNPTTEKIEKKVLEGLPGLGECGATTVKLPIRKTTYAPVPTPTVAADPCTAAEFCSKLNSCPAAASCSAAETRTTATATTTSDAESTPTPTVTGLPTSTKPLMSPMDVLRNLFKAAKAAPEERPKAVVYEGFRGIGKRNTDEFEAYIADLSNACRFNVPKIEKDVAASSSHESEEPTKTAEGATQEEGEYGEGEEGVSEVWDENEEGAEDGSEEWDENEEGVEDESQEWDGREEGQNLQKRLDIEHAESDDDEDSEEFPANGEADEADEDNEDTPDVPAESNARYKNYSGWYPAHSSLIHPRGLEGEQLVAAVDPVVPVAAPAPVNSPVVPAPKFDTVASIVAAVQDVPVATISPIEPVAPVPTTAPAVLSEAILAAIVTQTMTHAAIEPSQWTPVIIASIVDAEELVPTATEAASPASNTKSAKANKTKTSVNNKIRSTRVKEEVVPTEKPRCKKGKKGDACRDESSPFTTAPTPTIDIDATTTSTAAIPSISLSKKERKKALKALRKKPKPTMSKEAAEWDKKQRKKAERIQKEADRRAKSLRRMKFMRKLEKERARKAAERKEFLKEVGYQRPRIPQVIRRAPPPLDDSHPKTRLMSQGVKEEEQLWRMGRTSDADRAAAAAGIAKAAKQTELERLQNAERAEAAAAQLVEAGSKATPNAYLDHASYDPAKAHIAEEAARFNANRVVGQSRPELSNLGIGVTILIWIAIVVAILRSQKRRKERSPSWIRENGRRGFWEQGRKKRQSEEQEREKLDV